MEGFIGIGMDILGGDFAVDLADKDSIRVICDLVRSGRVKAIHGGLPCESFSPVRRGKRSVSNPRGYPARLRSRGQLWGLPTSNMTAGDKTCLERGNSCLEGFLAVVRVCLEHDVPVSLEQPEKSMMWQIPELLALKRSVMASFGKLEVDYCRFGKAFKKPTMDLISLNAVISSCEKDGQWEQALGLFSLFSTMSTSPDFISYSAAMSALEKGNQWQLALFFFDDMTRVALRPDVINFNAAISACEKQGRWQEALTLFSATPSPSVVTWNAVLSSCEKAGQWRWALQLLETMLRKTLEADDPWDGRTENGFPRITEDGRDPELWNFLRLLATLKAKVPDLASWLRSKEAFDGEDTAANASAKESAQSAQSTQLPRLLVVFNNVDEETQETQETQELEDFLKHTEWKAAPWIRCARAPHLPGQSAREMLCSKEAATLGKSLRQHLLGEGVPGGFGGLPLTEKQWLHHVLDYWEFIHKRSDVQSYFDLLSSGRLKSFDSPDPKSM
eukprot:s418_g28.t1